MTEQPRFQAPPVPPKAPAFSPLRAEDKMGAVAAEDDQKKTLNNLTKGLGLSSEVFKSKGMMIVWGGTLVVGMLLGALIFGGGSSQPPVIQGLTRIVDNPDIKQNLPRCGTVSESSPCAVYIVNHSRNDRYAEYFFDEATQKTGRQKYLVTIENQHYAKTRIPPGYVTQIKIPPLR